MYELMRIPKQHWDCEIDLIPDDLEHKAPLVNYRDNLKVFVSEGVGLFLRGPYSTGKSGAAAALMKDCLRQGILCMWVRASEVPSSIIENWGFNSTYTFRERMESIDFLVIDELIAHSSNSSGYRESAVEDLIRKRVDKGLTTVITSNESKEALKESFMALIQGIKHVTYTLNVSGKDWRAEGQTKVKGALNG